jgi:hypothetical protein
MRHVNCGQRYYTLSKAHILHTGRNLENVYIPTAKHNAHIADTSFRGILFVEVIGESYSDTHTYCTMDR